MSKSTSTTAEIRLFDGAILRRAAGQAVLKLNPRGLARNPVIFVTGLCELAGAVALVTRPLRQWAGLAFALYALCVWPAKW